MKFELQNADQSTNGSLAAFTGSEQTHQMKKYSHAKISFSVVHFVYTSLLQKFKIIYLKHLKIVIVLLYIFIHMCGVVDLSPRVFTIGIPYYPTYRPT